MSHLVAFVQSEEILKSVNGICDNLGWTIQNYIDGSEKVSLVIEDGADALLVEPGLASKSIMKAVAGLAERRPFFPLITIAKAESPLIDFGGSSQYSIEPDRADGLEHVLLSISCAGFLGSSNQERSETSVTRVMVVDDDPKLAQVLGHALRTSGPVDVRVLTSGFEAAATLPEFQPDVVVLDIVLRDSDGRRICSFIHNNDKLRHTKVIGISGYVPASQLKTSGTDCFDAFLEKPFRTKELIDTVKSLTARDALASH